MDNIEFRVIELFDNYNEKKINVVQIIINGNDLLDIFSNYACGDYMKASELYMWLTDKEYSSQYGSYLSCCPSCREPGCSSVSVMITETDDCVIWDRFHVEHEETEFDYKFVFDKEEYQRKVDELCQKGC